MSDLEKLDETVPVGRWEFDAAVTDVFDNMLKRSIPQYDVMRRSVFEVGSRFVRDNTFIVDLGCSRGEALAPFVGRFGARCSFLGIDVSEPMVAASRERFAAWIKPGVMEIRRHDLRTDGNPLPGPVASLVLSVLTLQFVPIEYRFRIVRDAFKTLRPGGALIVVEKVLGASAEIDELMVDRYLAEKTANGYTNEQIDRKRHSLEGVLVPVTARWNEELLRGSGFEQVECFWRWMNFAAWIALKA